MENKICIWILELILLASEVLALSIGVGPAYLTSEYEPGVMKNLQVRIYNKELSQIEISARVEGDLANYFRISEERFRIPEGQEVYPLNVEVELPAGLSPGTYVTRIVFSATPTSGTIGVGASVETQIYTVVKSEKFLLAMVNATAEELTLRIRNLGSAEVESASAALIISDKEREVFSINRSFGRISAGQERKITYRNPGLVGEYSASIWASYDGQERAYQIPLIIGEKKIDPISLEMPIFRLGEINRIIVRYSSNWNRPVNFTPKLEILDSSGRVIAGLSANSIEILKDGSADFFWDTSEVAEGRYTARAYSIIDGVSESRSFRLSVSSEGIRIDEESTLARRRTITVVLLSAFIIAFLIFGRRISSSLRILKIKNLARRAIKQAELRNIETAARIYNEIQRRYNSLSQSERKIVYQEVMSAYEAIKGQKRKKIEF